MLEKKIILLTIGPIEKDMYFIVMKNTFQLWKNLLNQSGNILNIQFLFIKLGFIMNLITMMFFQLNGKV